MATDNTNPKNAKPVGGRQSESNTGNQAGQASRGLGNASGMKASQQQRSGGTADQGGKMGRSGIDQAGGVLPQDRNHADASRKLRQGTPETEKQEE